MSGAFSSASTFYMCGGLEGVGLDKHCLLEEVDAGRPCVCYSPILPILNYSDALTCLKLDNNTLLRK